MAHQERKPNFSRTLINLIAGATILLTAMYIIPIEIYETNSITFSAIFGIIGAFFFYRAITGFWEKDGNNPEEKSTNLSVLWLSLLVVLMPVFLIIFQSNRKDNLLLKDGVLGTGVILNLKSYKVKNSSIYEAQVRYYDANNVDHIAIADIAEDEFYKVKRGDEVDIYYSRSNPKMISLLNSEYNRKKFDVNNFDLGIMEERPKTREEMSAYIKELENQIKEEKDKSIQVEILNKLLLAQNQLKEMDKQVNGK